MFLHALGHQISPAGRNDSIRLNLSALDIVDPFNIQYFNLLWP
jgi:hypothetical protein